MNRMRIAKLAGLVALIAITDSLLGRGGREAPASEPEYRNSGFWRFLHRVTQSVDQRRGWDSLPIKLRLVVLSGRPDLLLGGTVLRQGGA